MQQMVHYQRVEPYSQLKKYISYYWYMENTEEEVQEYPDLLIPDGYPEIIFVLEGSYYKRPLTDESQLSIVNESSVIGIQRKSLLVKRRGKVKLLGIKFKPMGFYRFFGERAVQTVGLTCSLREFEFDFLRELAFALDTHESLDQLVEKVDRRLLSQISTLPDSKKEEVVQICIQEILKAKGNLSLDELSTTSGKGKRQIQRYFKEYIGISPKKFSTLIRFKAVYKENILSDASLSHFFDHGYFDQSHFIKEFKANLGITPTHTSSDIFKVQNEIARRSRKP